MKTLTNVEALDWVRSAGLDADEPPRVFIPNNSSHVFTVRWPKILPHQVPHFANLFLPDENEDCLFWLADNGASGVMEFEMACSSLKLLRGAHGDQRGILESPAYILRAGERVNARLLVTMAVLFCWDAYVVPAHGRYFVWIDDDDAADVCCKNTKDYEQLLAKFRNWDLTLEVAPGNEIKT